MRHKDNNCSDADLVSKNYLLIFILYLLGDNSLRYEFCIFARNKYKKIIQWQKNTIQQRQYSE